MSIIDVTVSTSWFLTPFFVTQDMDQFLLSFGNGISCSLQGFIVQASIGGVLYNASLSLYYLLVIKYRFKKHQIAPIEKIMHAFALIFGIGTATAALAMDLYQDANWDCWISPEYDVFQLTFFFAPLLLAIIFVVTLMLNIYLHVKKEEGNSARYHPRIGDKVRLRKTRAVAKQGALYVGAFFVTWLFPTIARLYQLIWQVNPPTAIIVLAACFIPIQGFFNALVYFRLRYINCVEANPNRSRGWVVKTIMVRALSCCSTHERLQPDGLDIEPPSSSQNRASAVSAEPERPDPCHRRISITSIHRGLHSLYIRTNSLFFAGDRLSLDDIPPPETIVVGDDSIHNPGKNYHQNETSDYSLNASNASHQSWEVKIDLLQDEENQIDATAQMLR